MSCNSVLNPLVIETKKTEYWAPDGLQYKSVESKMLWLYRWQKELRTIFVFRLSFDKASNGCHYGALYDRTYV